MSSTALCNLIAADRARASQTQTNTQKQRMLHRSMYAHRRHLLVFFAMSASLCVAESEGHDHGDGGEPCGCAQFEADHPFTIDCSNKPYINAAIERLEALGTCRTPCARRSSTA